MRYKAARASNVGSLLPDARRGAFAAAARPPLRSAKVASCASIRAIALPDLALIDPYNSNACFRANRCSSRQLPCRPGDLGLASLAALVTQLGQLARVPLAGQDGSDDGQAGHAGDVADDLGSLTFICSSAFCMCWTCWPA